MTYRAPGGPVAIEAASLEEAAALAAVHVAGWQETYRGLLPDAVLDGITIERRETQWRAWLGPADPTRFVRVARLDDRAIVGFVMTGPARDVGAFADREIDALYLLRSHHGRGIGRRLLEEAVADASQRGVGALGFWVLAGNARALSVYAAAKAVEVARRSVTMAGRAVEEIGLRIRTG